MARGVGTVRAILGALLLAAACGPAPASFRMIGLARAGELLASTKLVVIEAVGDGHSPAGSVALPRWRTGDALEPALRNAPTDADILVVAADERTARLCAAAFARAGGHRVFAFVPRDANERGSFYASATRSPRAIQETQLGQDS